MDPNVSAGSTMDRPIGAEIILNDLTTQLNNASAREHWRDASILQHLMMDLLDLSYQNGYENPQRRRRCIEQLINRFEEMTGDARRNGHPDAVATYEARLQSFTAEVKGGVRKVRDSAHWCHNMSFETSCRLGEDDTYKSRNVKFSQSLVTCMRNFMTSPFISEAFGLGVKGVAAATQK